MEEMDRINNLHWHNVFQNSDWAVGTFNALEALLNNIK